MALPLRRSSIAAGLVTEAEFEALKARLHPQVRAFTLVPIPAVQMALATYGSTPASEALLTALELPRPADWPAMTQQDGEREVRRKRRTRARKTRTRMMNVRAMARKMSATARMVAGRVVADPARGFRRP